MPPTINLYYRHVGAKVLISKGGRLFRKNVADIVKNTGHVEGRLRVVLSVYPPDRRRRDLDNTQKAIGDSLQNAGVYRDDSQIDEWIVRRMAKDPEGIGYVLVIVETITEPSRL